MQSLKGAVHIGLEQTLAEQLSVPLGRVQAWPHVPQFIALVEVSISQPSAAFRLQSACGGVHASPEQVPLEQPWVPPTTLQAWPHMPQLFGSLDVLTSQPLAGFKSQSANPVLQVGLEHTPLEHVSVPPAVLHACPHVPQFFGSLDVSTSQPFEATPSQFANGAVHVGIEQAEATQLSLPPLWLHLLPQAPQLAAFVERLTSQPSAALMSQSALGGLHVSTHALLVQVSVPPVAVQVFLHVPQLFMSLVKLTSHPLEASPSQSAKPALHAVSVHVRTPATLVQASVAWLVLHDVLQSPQWLVVVIEVSQPFLTLLSQSAKPALHIRSVQLPPTHDSIPPLMLHGLPHPPQLAALVFRLTSHPFEAL